MKNWLWFVSSNRSANFAASIRFFFFFFRPGVGASNRRNSVHSDARVGCLRVRMFFTYQDQFVIH